MYIAAYHTALEVHRLKVRKETRSKFRMLCYFYYVRRDVS
jgi:hypothetical protein